MARNEEKAQSMLNRYLKQKDAESGKGDVRRRNDKYPTKKIGNKTHQALFLP